MREKLREERTNSMYIQGEGEEADSLGPLETGATGSREHLGFQHRDRQASLELPGPAPDLAPPFPPPTYKSPTSCCTPETRT